MYPSLDISALSLFAFPSLNSLPQLFLQYFEIPFVAPAFPQHTHLWFSASLGAGFAGLEIDKGLEQMSSWILLIRHLNAQSAHSYLPYPGRRLGWEGILSLWAAVRGLGNQD